MLRADVVVLQTVGFLGCGVEDALGLGAEGNPDRRRDLFDEDRPAFDFRSEILERQVSARENPARQAFAFPDESEQHVLGLNRDAPELAGFVP